MNKRQIYKKEPQKDVACCPCIKVRMNDIDGLEKEAQDRISYDNKNIDPKLSNLNLYIHGLDKDKKPIINTNKYTKSLQKRMLELLNKYNVKIRKDREKNKEDNPEKYTEKQRGQNTKESVLAIGIIFQLSHELAMKLLKEDGMLDDEGRIIKGKQLPKDSKTYKYFEDTYLFACKKWEAARIVGAYIHLDEYTPHMHLFVVPLFVKKKKYAQKVILDSEGNPAKRTSLNAKILFSRERVRGLWQDYAKAMAKYGARAATGLVPKGIYDTRTSMDEVEARAKEIEKELQEKECDLKHVNGVLDLFNEMYNRLLQGLQDIFDKLVGKGKTKVRAFDVKEENKVATDLYGKKTEYVHRQYDVTFYDNDTMETMVLTADQDDYYHRATDKSLAGRIQIAVSSFFINNKDLAAVSSLANKAKTKATLSQGRILL